MKIQAELLSVLAYLDKNSKQPKTRLAYRCLDSKYRQNTDKLKGFSDLSVYLDTHQLFKELKPEHFGVQAELEMIEVPAENNPFRKTLKLKTIRVGNDLISVL